MPHIVADNEATAWYALGYEQARDALLWIQYACKAAKGELTWVRGVGGITSDIAVKVFNAHGRLAGMSPAERQAFFASSTPGINANFYDNCVAFAAGADAYRVAVLNASPQAATPQGRLHLWLDSNFLGNTPFFPAAHGQANLAWVYQHAIEAVDIAAQGAWTTAGHSLRWPHTRALINSQGPSYGLLPGPDATGFAEAEPADPLAPGSLERWGNYWRQQFSVLPGAPSAFLGSNTFAWSRLYCEEGTTKYSGLLGDPHQGIPSFDPIFRRGFAAVPNHLWFAHVKVTPPGASQPSLDVLGHVPHAAAAFFTCHNRNVAMGGTFGGPNHADLFLLRLCEDSTGNGTPHTPYKFYSYYDDGPTITNGGLPNNPADPAWRNISTETIHIKRWDGVLVPVPYWRAESFGVILPDPDVTVIPAHVVLYPYSNPPTSPPAWLSAPPIVYGERVVPNSAPRWRVSADGGSNPIPRMRFWATPQIVGGVLTTSPMVMALRAPIDANVAGEDMHWQLIRDFWEMNHATQVADVVPKTNGAAYLANLCFVDREGRTFSTQTSKIPQRGNDTQLFALQSTLNPPRYYSADKWAIYNSSLPVPARHSDDQMFDWQFNANGSPRYLEYPPAQTGQYGPTPPAALALPGATTAIAPFKPMTWQDPRPGVFRSFPPLGLPPSSHPFRVQSGFFTSACNDQIWGYSRKRDMLDPMLPFRRRDLSLTQVFNDVQFSANALPVNELLQWVLQAGVPYQSVPFALEGPDRQQVVVEQFTRQAECATWNMGDTFDWAHG